VNAHWHWLIGVIAYALGSIPFGLLIVKARGGGDIRESGSGNIGAANVTRNAGFTAGALTLVLDAAKGWLAVWLASYWTGGDIRWVMAAAILVVAGHVFPLWLGFKGGKGVATSLGAFLVICPHAVGAGVALWLLVVGFWGYSSLGSILMEAAMPLFVYLLYEPRHAPPSIVTGGIVAISLLVLAKHRANLERLVAGTEERLRPPRQ
jgi:acyl phosphate:glycerol-3-phosphate acyltransferase